MKILTSFEEFEEDLDIFYKFNKKEMLVLICGMRDPNNIIYKLGYVWYLHYMIDDLINKTIEEIRMICIDMYKEHNWNRDYRRYMGWHT